MDDKNKIKLSEDEMLDKIGNESVTQHLDKHLEQNIASQEKKKIDPKTILTYVGMVLVVIACIIIIYVFLDKNDANPFTKTTTTTTNGRAKTVLPTSNTQSQAKTVTTSTTVTGNAPVKERETTEPYSTTQTSYHTVKRN